jgi:ADP-ribose pyrophosphatase YjhB (NUDIX family)
MSAIPPLSAVGVVIEEGRILLVRHAYANRRWALPGGAVEPGETPLEAAVRETSEEVGARLLVERELAVYTFVDADGEVVQLGHAYLGSLGGKPSIQDRDEIEDIRWFDAGALPRPLTNFAAAAIADAVSGSAGRVRRVVRH